ncbi:uncharacterized protein LOC117178328 [Belonocnema kinseyi]|uniref:uncharacterized protein LOC117178328 n=1 Tax=Belonocnema kinseyi TaxID=2817044 RepID=UPI00143D5AF6|nr:uncharacterized protein LOC117178328 [Belonocnema kinseyi]XP_033225625.1 uncharacterized protein LOC117178328 [Belonocnema kinseyi]
MNAKEAESYLGALYSITAILSTISIVSLVVAWQYWSWTLGVCMNVDCGCILYGVNTFSTFLGGDVKICHFGTYGLTPVLFIGLCLGIYHGYRSCIPKGLDEPRVVSRNRRPDNRDFINEAVIVVRSKQRPPCKQWMLASFLAAILGLLSLAHAVVLTDGYYKTCEQYRRNLVKILGSRGREIQVIHNRLPCGSIFDFMDYLTPDANNWRRGDEINTGVSLQLAITSTWLNFFAWILIFTINFIMAKRRNSTLGEKLCCCF